VPLFITFGGVLPLDRKKDQLKAKMVVGVEREVQGEGEG
jgi:hypothetical protein